MISDERHCIFVHVPRCAGTSVEDVIWPDLRTEDELWMGFVDRYHNKYQTGGLQHLSARQIRKEVGAERFGSYFKFAVVRNPFDRAVSQFAYMRRRPDLRSFIDMDVDASFSDYLKSIRRRRHVQWDPQCSLVCDEDGGAMVDFVARFERLTGDMAHVFARLGLRGAHLPHLNSTEHPPYRQHYTADQRRQVERMYRHDFERFGYEF